jgi:hypothetical protein
MPRVNWRYGLGELAIVVVGILLAVQIDRWNTGREQATTAQSYLDRLAQDLQADTSILRANAEKYQSWSENADRLLSWMEDPANAPPFDSLAMAINGTRGGTLNAVRGTTYRDLVSAGNLVLFDSVELRDAIISYYESVPSDVAQDMTFSEGLSLPLFASMGRHVDDRVLFGPEDRRRDHTLFVTDWRSFATDPLVGQQPRLWAPGTYDSSTYHTALAARARELLERVVAAGGRVE